MRELFPTKFTLPGQREEASDPERGHQFRLDDIRYEYTGQELLNGNARNEGDVTHVHNEVLKFVDADHIDLSNGPFDTVPDVPLNRPSHAYHRWLRGRAMMPCWFPKPNGGREVYAFTVFHNALSLDVRNLAHHLRDHGTIFAANSQEMQLEWKDDPVHGLLGPDYENYEGHDLYPIATCLTDCPTVLLDGEVLINPFFKHLRKSRLAELVREDLRMTQEDAWYRNITGRWARANPPLDPPGQDNGEMDYQFWGAMRNRAQDIQRFYDQQRGTWQRRLVGVLHLGWLLPEKKYTFTFHYYGREHSIIVLQPLPPGLGLEKYVSKMIDAMAEDEQKVARRILEGMKPVPVHDTLRVHHELSQKSQGPFSEQKQIPAYHYKGMLRAHEAMFRLWQQQVVARYNQTPKFEFDVQEGGVGGIAETATIIPAGAHYEQKCSGSQTGYGYGSRALLLFNPQFYRQVLDEIAAWKSPGARSLLVDHHHRVTEMMAKTPSLGDDILKTVEERIRACQAEQNSA
ncbi:hypothetical protein HYS47_04425 [Candidatus Woesearchaeota archaeon]|nr:hypothetical protein [Candidatus Woesearchaeota archaeon]